METRRCRGARRDGSPCAAAPHTIGPSGFCWAHDPDNAGARREAQAKGGRNKGAAARAEKLVPATLRPTLATLLAAVDEVKDGKLMPGQASAMASLAGAIVRLYQTGILEERIASLEALQEQADTRRGA